jgi:hypothetical protein
VSPGAVAADVRFLTVTDGTADANQAIVDLQVRVAPAGALAASVQLANYSAEPVRRVLTVTDARSGDEIERQTVDLPASGTLLHLIQLPPDAQRIRVRLIDVAADALALDDVVDVTTPHGALEPQQVVLVSESPTALERVLDALPHVELRVVAPDAYDPRRMGADITVFDGFLPDVLPLGALLVVDPPADNPLLPAVGTARGVEATSFDPLDPLLAGIDLVALRFAEAQRLEHPPSSRTVVGSAEGPLVLDSLIDGRLAVVFAFDPEDAGLTRSLAFPLLVRNAVSHLAAGRAEMVIDPGEVIAVAAPRSGSAVLVRPDGRRHALRASGGQLLVGDTDAIGRYAVLDSEDQVLARFAVQLLDRAESDIRPRDALPLIAPADTTNPQTAEEIDTPVSEWWRWLVVAGLVALSGEWLLFARRDGG